MQHLLQDTDSRDSKKVFSSPRFCVIALLYSVLPAVAGAFPGVNNFDQVDAHVYRGGQPTPEGFRHLADLGIKTVVDLRESGDRAQLEQRTVTAAGMAYVNVPMTGLTPPTAEQINNILKLLEDTGSGPVFVHCQRGADRTGAVIAAYHIDHDKWDNSRALKDAKAHSMSSFQLPRQNFIKEFRPRSAVAAVTSPPGASIAQISAAASR